MQATLNKIKADAEAAGRRGRGVDAVIVAGALYANRWHRDARRFVRRQADSLRTLPVWLVSSGPLDYSAAQREIAPTKQLVRLSDPIGAIPLTFVAGCPASWLRSSHASLVCRHRTGNDAR
jgi:menaquinone-dependent protoporphyrinogen oxidase